MSVQNEKTADEIIKAIGNAFQDVPYPGENGIVYNNSGYHLECMEIRQAFAGKFWQDITDLEFLRHHAQSVFFFTPDAYRYYLPAFLMAVCRSPVDAIDILGAIEYSLAPPQGVDDVVRKWHSKITRGLTNAQMSVIEDLRVFLRSQYPECYLDE